MAAEHPWRTVDRKWQKWWEANAAFRADDSSSAPKFYVLNMFPYPSGSTLHIGHTRTYIIGDVLARSRRMKGFNVMNPMGWDAFGLPAENAAIKAGMHPAKSNLRNVGIMKKQLQDLGISYDWSREVSTDDPDYYRWTQWIFLRMHERGLAYRKKGLQNWCPSCATVLANEQVEEGTCWRCHSVVEKKELEQWFLKITSYADRLLADLKLLARWPERVKIMQANWIGRSEGARIMFREAETGAEMPVFTTRADTLFGVTFVVIAPEHPLVAKLAKGTPREGEVLAYAEKARKISERMRTSAEREKTGVPLGRKVVNPANGEAVPVFVTDYVLMDYGTGIVMGVPAHDQRDFEFAREHNLPVRVVISPPGEKLDGAKMGAAYVEDGVQVNSGKFDGMPNTEGMWAIVDHLANDGKAERTVSYHLRDWLISRQRYWGVPIPMVNCGKCGFVPVPEGDLPVRLPTDIAFDPGVLSPLLRVKAFVEVKCPRCGGAARRETDTMDTFMDSSWYFLRYASPKCGTAPFDRKAVDRWMPVDEYVGGIEHAIMHLLYSRFFQKFLFDLGVVRDQEPFGALFAHGMVLKDGEVMSKSKGNTVTADEIIARYGCDTVRTYMMFAAPPEKDLEWSDSGIEGVHRFLKRVEKMVDIAATDNPDKEYASKYPYNSGSSPSLSDEEQDAREILRMTHETIMRVERDLGEGFHFNTAVSALMELSNMLSAYQVTGIAKALPRNYRPGDELTRKMNDTDNEVIVFALKRLVLLLAPFAPHLAEEWWKQMGEKPSIMRVEWPKYRVELSLQNQLAIPVQINGRLRATIILSRGAAEAEVRKAVLDAPRIRTLLEGREPRRWVIVPDKLVNLVL